MYIGMLFIGEPLPRPFSDNRRHRRSNSGTPSGASIPDICVKWFLPVDPQLRVAVIRSHFGGEPVAT
jgi:hypothetical protein